MAIFRHVLRSKIHGPVITKRELYYNGSIGIDASLLLKSDIAPGEKVQVLNFNNGMRFETYVIEKKEKSGTIALYGPAARCGEIGDRLCIISYAFVTSDEIGRVTGKEIFVNEKNEIRD